MIGAGSASPVVSIARRSKRGNRTALASAEQLADRIRQIAPDGAAHAAALQDHRLGVERLQQQMVEPDLAELVDQHRGARELRRAQQPVEERGLAAAEKPGDHVDRDQRLVRSHAQARSRAAISSRARGSHGRAASLSAALHMPARCGTSSVRPVAERST